MGEIVASMKLENAEDRGVVRRGLSDVSTIRSATVDGVVDTGAVMLVLPEDVVGRLGLATQREVVVTYADERKETRPGRGTSGGAYRRSLHDRGVRHRSAFERAVNRRDRAGSAGLGCGLRQSNAGAAAGVAGPSPPQAEVTPTRQSVEPRPPVTPLRPVVGRRATGLAGPVDDVGRASSKGFPRSATSFRGAWCSRSFQ